MNKDLLFDFSVNKQDRTIHVKREFNADTELVWKAWTTAELLDQWWAPKPYRNETKSLDFREGGTWHYSMTGPENDRHWACLDYSDIDDGKAFSGRDAFCDENAKINADMPRSVWRNRFSGNDGKSAVDITITFDDLADLEKTIEMGFKEGFTMGLENLDELLLTLGDAQGKAAR